MTANLSNKGNITLVCKLQEIRKQRSNCIDFKKELVFRRFLELIITVVCVFLFGKFVLFKTPLK